MRHCQALTVRHSAEQLADLHIGEEFHAIRLELRDGEVGYWTVLDGNLHRVPVVDDFLFAIIRSGRAENTSRAYAHDIAAFLRWSGSRRRPWMDVRSLSDFQAFLLVDRSRRGTPRAAPTIEPAAHRRPGPAEVLRGGRSPAQW